jgi:Cellulose binding domain
MVTPTFAAGLGVVVAASLAANMTKTVLHFSSPFPSTQCAAGVCTTEKPNSGTLASARPGVHIAPNKSGHSGDHRGGAGSAGQDAQQVTVTYQLAYQWQGGFADEIRISGINERQQSSWSLAFGYPGARVTDVRGAQWQATSPDAGVAEGYAPQGAGGPWGPGGLGDGHGSWGGYSMVQFTVELAGSPMAPVGCDFDGTPCTFSASGPH